jgi:hypothetical protein
MPQVNDWSIDNLPGISVRAQINGINDAVQSCSSGPTAPSPTVAGMLWFDTGVSPPVPRQRNAANTGWNRLIDTADIAAARAALGIGQMAVVNRATVQSIPNATSTAISWDNVQVNDGTIYGGGSPTRLTVPAGATRVRVTLSAYWAVNNTGIRNLKITINGASDIVFDIRPAQNETGAAISRVYLVTAGDYFEAFVNQNSGGALNIGGNNGTAFSLEVLR